MDRGLPSTEICDGLDNDCDGETDEDTIAAFETPGVDPTAPGDVRFIEAANAHFLAGGVGVGPNMESTMWVSTYDETGARLADLQLLATGASGEFRALVLPSGNRAIVTRVNANNAPVYVAVLDLTNPSTPTPLVGLDQAILQLDPVPVSVTPVYDEVADELVLFIYDAANDIQAVRLDVQNDCDPLDEPFQICAPSAPPTEVIADVVADYAVMAPSDGSPFVLAYRQGTTMFVAPVDRTVLMADETNAATFMNASNASLQAGPNGTGALTYTSAVDGRLYAHRFVASTLECINGTAIPLEACPDIVVSNGDRASLAYDPEDDTWLLGHGTASTNWALSLMSASDGEILAQGEESVSSDPARLAVADFGNDGHAALVSKDETIRPVHTMLDCPPLDFTVSVDSSGVVAGAASTGGAISGDGSTVAFSSLDDGLGCATTRVDAPCVYLHDIATGQTNDISFLGESRGAVDPSLSFDGQTVVFAEERALLSIDIRLFGPKQTVASVWDKAGENDFPEAPVISSGGDHVAFVEEYGALHELGGLGLEDTNGVADVYFYDVNTALLYRVSKTPASEWEQPAHSPALSGDAAWLAYQLDIPGASWIFVVNPTNPDTSNFFVGSNPSIDEVGSLIAHEYDTGAYGTVRVYERSTGQSSEVALDTSGNPPITQCDHPIISADSRYVAFHCYDPMTSHGAFDQVYVRDLQEQTTKLASVGPSGQPANAPAIPSSMSYDGSKLIIESAASNLGQDSGGVTQVFMIPREFWKDGDP